jgi:hypothetical protein
MPDEKYRVKPQTDIDSFKAARSAPLSDPANSHDFLASARPRSERSAALLERQMPKA